MVNKTPRKWKAILASGHKLVYTNPDTELAVRQTMERRSAEILEEFDRDEAWVDNPGMCFADRKYWTTQVDGFNISFPVSDFHSFLGQVRETLGNGPKRADEPDRTYYSIYGWQAVITLAQSQLQTLYDNMVAQSAQVRVDADAEDLRWSHAISKVNDNLRSSGSPIQIVSARADMMSAPMPADKKDWN